MHVVILGAGPAGAACAIRLLMAGVRVSIVERREFPGMMPGESLHPGIESLLRQLEVFDEVAARNFLRYPGVFCVNRHGTRLEYFNRKENWRGFQLFRREFDSILLQKAISLGARYHGHQTPQKTVIIDGCIRQIITEDEPIEGDIFVDATGRRAWLARQIGTGYRTFSPKMIVHYGYVSGSAHAGRYNIPHFMWGENGWSWIAQVSPEMIAWNRLYLDAERIRARDGRPAELSGFKDLSPIKGADVTWKIAERLSAGNYFLAGDSGFVLDPAAGHGVLKAIMSGVMIAYLLEMEYRGQAPRHALHQHYDQWMNSWFMTDVRRLKKLYLDNNINLSRRSAT